MQNLMGVMVIYLILSPSLPHDAINKSTLSSNLLMWPERTWAYLVRKSDLIWEWEEDMSTVWLKWRAGIKWSSHAPLFNHFTQTSRTHLRFKSSNRLPHRTRLLKSSSMMRKLNVPWSCSRHIVFTNHNTLIWVFCISMNLADNNCFGY